MGAAHAGRSVQFGGKVLHPTKVGLRASFPAQCEDRLEARDRTRKKYLLNPTFGGYQGLQAGRRVCENSKAPFLMAWEGD
jgi:hypothetical protein